MRFRTKTIKKVSYFTLHKKRSPRAKYIIKMDTVKLLRSIDNKPISLLTTDETNDAIRNMLIELNKYGSRINGKFWWVFPSKNKAEEMLTYLSIRYM